MVFTEHVKADTTYYFAVKTADGAGHGYSQGYKLTTTPVPRRLYGASLVI